MSDQRDPMRQTNTMLLNRATEPPPASLLLTVLGCTDGQAPSHLVVHADFDGPKSVWRIIGATDRLVFSLLGEKEIARWHGGGNGTDDGRGDSVQAWVYPLATFRGAEFMLTQTVRGDFSRQDSEIRGLWTLNFAGGSIDVSTGGKTANQSDRDDARTLVNHVLAFKCE